MTMVDSKIPLDDRSKYLRSLVIRGLKGGNRGHVGPSMSPIEIMRVLYDDIMRYDPQNPKMKERDRFILSKGHGCLALYAFLVDKGFISAEELDRFCRPDGILGGHPEHGKVPGVEASTGSLGHGLSIGVGMSLAARMDQSDRRVFVVMGDGEINEGSVWEAAMAAGKHKLSNLIAIVDYNKIQSAGRTEDIQDLEPLTDKWASFGFEVAQVDGHNVDEIRELFQSFPLNKDKPTAVIAHTVKGKGIPFAEWNPKWHHHSKFDDETLKEIYDALEMTDA